MVVTFDTLKASRNLKAAGFDESQATAIIDTMGDAFGENRRHQDRLGRAPGRPLSRHARPNGRVARHRRRPNQASGIRSIRSRRRCFEVLTP